MWGTRRTLQSCHCCPVNGYNYRGNLRKNGPINDDDSRHSQKCGVCVDIKGHRLHATGATPPPQQPQTTANIPDSNYYRHHRTTSLNQETLNPWPGYPYITSTFSFLFTLSTWPRCFTTILLRLYDDRPFHRGDLIFIIIAHGEVILLLYFTWILLHLNIINCQTGPHKVWDNTHAH
jgi:hypothetical protein